MFRIRNVLSCLLLASCVLIPSARADLLVQGTFQGQVTYIDSSWAPPPVAVFESYVATFTYDADTADADVGSSGYGAYLGALKSIELSFAGGFELPISLPVDGHVFVDPTLATVRLVYPYGVRAATSDSRYSVEAIDIALRTASLPDDSPPTSMSPNLTSAGALYTLFDDDTHPSDTTVDFWVNVAPNSLTIHAVPEPSAACCLALPASLFGWYRYRQRRHGHFARR
jgi:hypothetical protein